MKSLSVDAIEVLVVALQIDAQKLKDRIADLESRPPQTVIHNHYHYQTSPNTYQPIQPIYPYIGDPPPTYTQGPTCGPSLSVRNLCGQ